MYIMLESDAISFCHYEKPVRKGRHISSRILEETVAFAERNGMEPFFLTGDRRAPRHIERILDRITHTKIFPLKLRDVYSDGIVVVDRDDYGLIERSAMKAAEKFILRSGRNHLGILGSLVDKLIDYAPVDVVLSELALFTKSDFSTYAIQLDTIKDNLIGFFKNGMHHEVPVLTDRLHLDTMSNCNAGSDHCTVSPDGNIHLCPGFFHTFPEYTTGTITQDTFNPLPELLSLERAPLCSSCTTYHCRRCFYLNLLLTGEINTPSQQQCVTSNLERMCSFYLRDEILHYQENHDDYPPFAEPPLLDPLASEYLHRMMPNSTEHSGGIIPANDPERNAPGNIGKISLEERDEIRRLYERKSALVELLKSLADIDKRNDAKLYEKLVEDMAGTSSAYQRWFDETGRKYLWKNIPGYRWRIDFDSCEVYLEQS